jgi:hypothetical protein
MLAKIRIEATGQISAKTDPISAKPVPKSMQVPTLVRCPLAVQ